MIGLWQGVFWAAATLALLKNLVQGWQGRGQSDPQGGAADVQRYVIYALYLAVWGIAVLQRHPVPPMVLFAGAAAIVTGSGVTLLAMRTLGQSYQERIEPGEDAVLQTAGVFRWVRHPMRVGLAIELLGVSLSSLDWIAAALTIVVGWLLIVRSRQEEALLALRYGTAYARYRETTPAFPMGPLTKLTDSNPV
ncbi:MAG: isoprenylcysteine carboxylmethyltransferase family protein [Actinomycetota bacterium]|nr:isoprenylcysteine carboxylmethyltransferase family protein [Actinomycetota bacterium]